MISLLQKNYRKKDRAGDACAIGKLVLQLQVFRLHAASGSLEFLSSCCKLVPQFRSKPTFDRQSNDRTIRHTVHKNDTKRKSFKSYKNL